MRSFIYLQCLGVVHEEGPAHVDHAGVVAEQDQIHLATSQNGIQWVKQGVVLDVGPAGSWEPDRVGRPTVLHEDGEFRMWYDGQIFQVARHVGYATSPDGFSWTRYPNNPVVLKEGAVDVDRVGDWYVMLSEGLGTGLRVSKDRLNWQVVGDVLKQTGQANDAFGQVTPFLLTKDAAPVAMLYGGASAQCWCKNRIALALIGAAIPGCQGCLSGQSSCQAACEAGGQGSGHCAAPGSTSPSACCACSDPGCGGCLAGQASCHTACSAAGKTSGWCAHPGSTDPSVCCGCF